MIEIGNSLDGTVEKAISATEKLNGLPKFAQKFALAGDFSLGSAKKVDLSNYTPNSKEFQNYIALISTLDEKQRNLIVSMTTLGKNIKQSDLSKAFKQLSDGELLNGAVVEKVLKENDFSKKAIEDLTAIKGLKDATTGYGLALTSKAIPAMEQWINEHTTAIDVTKMLNDNIITGTEGNYQFTDSFKDLIIQKQKDVAVTKQLTTEQMFWNAALQIGKQLLVSFAIGAFIAAIQKGIQAWKDYRDRFVNGMNDAHDAAEEAKADVDSIQAKIDELNEKVKAAGANQISDIVDPAERAKLQETNDQLEKQLKLKQQIQEIEEQEEHDNAVGVYNTKDETVYKDADGNYDYSMGIHTDSAGYKATGTEALDYYTGMLNEYTEKYNNLLSTVGEDDPQTKAAKEQMDFAKDEVVRLSKSLEDLQGHLKDTSDEYSAVSTALEGASDALSYYNGEINITQKESRLGRQLRYEQKELDATTKAYKKYTELQNQYGKYGNIDNFNRGIVEWTDENLNKYSQFAEENGAKKGDYSTVNGRSVNVNELHLNSDAKEQFSGEIAFSPMLQTEDGVVPLTNDQIENYLRDVIETAAKMEGGATPENILKVDKEGLLEDINGVEISINNMIAAVEGQIMNGAKLSALDVIAIAGATEEELGDEFGNQWSKYFGRSMHDIQSQAVDLCKVIKNKWNDIWSDDVDTSKFNEQLSNSGNIQNALNLFGGSADAEYLKAIGQSGPKTKEQTEAFEILNKVAARLHTTYEKLIDAMEEEGIVASQSAVDTTAMSEASSKLDEVQAAYKSLRDAQKEYNKQGYLTADTLQSILDLDPKYQACLVEENGKLNINKGTIKNLTNSYYELMKAKVYSQAIDDLKEMDTYQKAVDFLGQAKQETKDWLSLMQATANVTLETSGLSGEGWDKLNEAQQARIKTAQTMVDLITQTQKQSLDKQFPDTTKSTKSTKTAIDAWSTLSSAMKEFNEQGYITFQTLKSLTDLEDKYSSMLKKNDVTGQLEMRTDDFYKLMKAELKEAQTKGDGASEAQYNKILEWTNRNIKNQTMSYWDLVAAIEGYSSALSEAKEITDGFKSAWDNGKTVKQKTEKSRTGALDYEGTEAQSSALQDLMKYSEYDPELIGKAFNKETGKIDLSGDMLKTAVAESLRQQAAAARTEGGEAAEAIAASYEKSAENIENDVISVQDYFDGLGSTVDEINEKIDDIQSNWTDLNDAVNEYNIYDGLSVDTLQKLLTMSPEYLACLKLEGGQLSVNADAMKDLLITQLEAKAVLLESKDETRDQAKILREMIAQLEKNGISALSGLDQYAKNLEDTLSNIKSLFSDLLGVFEQANTDKSNDLKIQGDAWLEIIDKRINALNEQNDAQERAIELSKAQDALEKAKANKTVHVYHAGGSGFEWEADENAVRDAQSTLNDTIRKNRKEDELERLNKLKEAVQKNNELIGSSFEDYEKKKKYLAEFDKMTYDDMISYNENWKDSIIGNMKSTQVVTNINDIITKIEKLVTTLETLNNVLTWIITLGKSTDGGGLTGLFSENGLFSKVGKFFSIASDEGLGAALNQTGEWFSGKLSAALEANPNNPIIKAFSNLWTAVGDGASKFFTETSGTGLGGIIKTGIEKAGTLISGLGGSEGVLGTIATTVKTGISSIGTTLAGGSSALPVIGPLIAVAVNNAVQQFGKISKENTKIWADKNSTTCEKIVSSVGNVLYHLSPVEGWDKSVQYAKMAAEGEGLWQKLEYGAKSLYYATGLGVMLDNIWSTIKSILKVFGVKFKEGDDNTNPPSSVPDKKGIGSWKIWPWNWGKKAKGDKKIKKSAPYNVDEEGDEIIVRKPQIGRMTYLEKGDGVIPANETENLMTIGKNPLKWLTENVGKILGSSAAKDVVEGKVDEGAVTKASQVLANSVVNTFSSAWNSVKMSTEDLIDSMNDSFQGGSTSVTTAAGTILGRVKTMFGKFNLGKLLGSFSSGVSGAISKSAKEYSSTTELLSGTKSKTIDTMNKMRSTFESTWASVAKETGVNKDKITSISSEMFSKMETLVNQTYDAIDSNAGMSSDQLNDITKSLFQSMQSIYTSGWNAVYATSTGMSQETANTLNSAYKSSSDSCTQAMDTIRNTMVGSWEQCGGGVQNLASGTYQTLSKAWADSSGSAEKMLYDTRACFDSGWGAVEQGVSNLANNPKDKLSTAWAEITSQSNATFGAEGTLKTDADNAWKNVEPGATNLSKNMQWTMDQAYLATKQGCSDTVNSVNTNLNSTSAGFSAIASAIDDVNKKASDSEEVAKNTGHAWYEWVLNPVGTLLDTITKYNTEDKSKNNFLQNAVHTVTHPISSAIEAGGKALKYVGNAAKDFLGGLFGKHASGLKSASKSHFANVDELGPELLVRKPQSGRYTYLETGDGVVPADITSKLFEMGGNPNKWFSEQMAKYGSQAITTKSTGNTSFSTGNIVINNPVGNSEDLASEIKKNFSTRMAQEWNKR